MVGEVPVDGIFSSGDTLPSITYAAGDAAFVHDTLMMPESGTSRADFPGGSSADLHASIARILTLPDATRVFVGHYYAPNGREARCESTVAEQKAANIRIKDGFDRAVFMAMRDAPNATLPLSKLMLAALQVKICEGRPPEPKADGHRYLNIPLDRFVPRIEPRPMSRPCN